MNQPGPPATPPRAVILAAGRGSRLGGPDAPPKPLVPLLGRRLIDYALDAVATTGIPEALVVTGYGATQVEAALAATRPRDSGLRFVFNPAWDGPASTSLRAARNAAGREPFLLLMSDHVPSPAFLRRFLERAAAGGSSVAVDRTPRDAHFIAEATLVDADAAGRVTGIGKGRTAWNAIDAGAFLLQPSAWEAVAWAPERCELSVIFQRLAESQGLHAADISGEAWYDVDTIEDLADAEVMLTKGHIAQVTKTPLEETMDR